MISYKRITNILRKKRKFRRQVNIMLVCVGICAFLGTYLLLTQNAITMESADLVEEENQEEAGDVLAKTEMDSNVEMDESEELDLPASTEQTEGTTPPADTEQGEETTPPAGTEQGEETTPPAGTEQGEETTLPADTEQTGDTTSSTETLQEDEMTSTVEGADSQSDETEEKHRCTVWYVDANYQPSTSQSAVATQNSKPSFAMANMAISSTGNFMANEIDDGSINEIDSVPEGVPAGAANFKDYIDSLVINMNHNGVWNPETVFQNGDKIQIQIDYTILDPKETNVIYYKLDDVIKLDTEDKGEVYFNGVVVGGYTISTDGLIVITFDPDKFDTGIAFTGHLEFEASVEVSEGHENEDVVFDGSDLTFDYVEKEEPDEGDKQYDLSTGKAISTKNEDGSYDYTVTVSSNNGTNDTKIDINDEFLVNNYGGQNAQYDEDSFVITKVDANGVQTVITDIHAAVDNNETKSSFNINDLPALGEKEKYVITYSATPDNDTDNTTSDGAMNVGNKVHVESENLKADASITAQVSGGVVNKTGTYDPDNKEASWVITIDPGVQNLAGYILEDTVTASDGTVIALEGATIEDSDGVITEINLPYTFPEDFDNTKDYKITYHADLSGLSNNTNVTVNNKVEIKEDDELKFEAGTSLPPIYNLTYDVDKKFVPVDGSGNKYNWITTITIPDTVADINQDLVCTDTINTTLINGTQGNVDNAHYTTVGDLRNIVIKVDGELVDSSVYSIKITELNYTWYDNNDITNQDIKDDVKVRTFEVNFKKDFLQKHNGEKLTMEYGTYIDTTNTEENGEYQIQNTAAVGNDQVTADTTYEKKQGVTKESRGNGSNFSGDPASYEYDVIYDETLGYAVMNYRVSFKTDIYSLEELEKLTMTDTLPQGASLVADSVEYYFGTPYKNQVVNEFWYNNEKFIASNLLTCSSTVTEDESEVLTFSLLQAYFEHLEKLKNASDASNFDWVEPLTLIIDYKIQLPPPSEWDGETEKLFVNHLSYGNEVVENEVTVESDKQYMSKTGEREPAVDADGKPMYNTDGSVRYNNNVNYTLVVNQEERELNLNGPTVVITDTLKFTGANGATASLVRDKFAVYRYDADQPDGKGEVVSTDEYSYTTREEVGTENGKAVTSYIFDLTIPDSEAFLITYTYYIDTSEDKTVDGFHIGNSVTMEGSSIYKDEKDIVMKKESSQATVEQQSLTLFKYEAGNEGKALAGAKFKIEKYKPVTDSTTEYKWVSTNFGENSTLTTGENGMTYFNLFGDNGLLQYEVGILYRVIEIEAPEGYRLDDTPKYFVWVDKNNEDYQNGILSYAQYVKRPAEVYVKDILFIENDYNVIPIVNKRNEIAVHKNWVDQDNELIDAPQDEITIDLYRQESKLVDSHTITVKSIPNGVEGDGHSEESIEKTLQVSEGSGLVIAVINSLNIQQNITVNGTTTQGVGNPAYPNVKYYRTDAVTEDLNIVIQAQNAPGQTFDFYFFEFDQAKYEPDPTSEKVKVGTYTLTKDGNWTKEWELVETVIDEDGELLYSPEGTGANSDYPYYYTVEESSVPSGFTVTYSDNDHLGINNGILTITNKENAYQLPSTGSTGTKPYRVGGILLFLFTTMAICIIKTKCIKQKNTKIA